MEDRRSSPRVSVNQRFRTFKDFAVGYLANVSSSGAFIATDKPLSVGTEFTLSFTIEEADGAFITGTGEVVRVSESPAGMGVVFTKLTPASREMLEQLILRHAVRGGEGEEGTSAPEDDEPEHDHEE